MLFALELWLIVLSLALSLSVLMRGKRCSLMLREPRQSERHVVARVEDSEWAGPRAAAAPWTARAHCRQRETETQLPKAESSVKIGKIRMITHLNDNDYSLYLLSILGVNVAETLTQ